MGQGASNDSAALLGNTDHTDHHSLGERDQHLLQASESLASHASVEIADTDDIDVTNIDERLDTAPPIMLIGHTGAVNDCAVSADSKWLVTAGADGTGKVWDTNGENMSVLKGHEGEVRSCAAFPDAQRALTSGEDGTVCVWNAYTGELIKKLCGHEGAVFSCAIFPNGSQIVTACSDCKAFVWDVESNRVLLSLQGPEDPRDRREPFGYTPNGQSTTSAVGAGPCCCAVSPDGLQVALVGGDDGAFVATIWDAVSGDQICELGDRCCYGCIFFPDGQRLATFGEELSVHDCTVWDISSEEELCSLRGHHYINGCAVFPSGDLAVAVGDDGLARVFRITRIVPDGSAQYCDFDCGDAPVRACTVFPDGSRVVTASGDGTARIWMMP